MRVRVRMLQSVDQLYKGFEYLLDQRQSSYLIANGLATHAQPRPSEIKPVEPTEIKSDADTTKASKRRRARASEPAA